MELGERLRGLRKRRKLTGRAAARYLGISGAHVSDMESGKALPSLDMLTRLVNYFHTSADYLLGLTDDPSPAAEQLFAQLDPDTVASIQQLIDEMRDLTPSQRKRVLAATKTIKELYEPYIVGGINEGKLDRPNEPSE